MAEETGKTSSKKKKGKKLGTPAMIGLGLGGAVVLYILYQWYQTNAANNAASTAAGIDPLTGNPYQAGVGSLAPGASSPSAGSTTLPDPTIDPATGATWASEIAAANTAGQTSGATDPLTGQPYSSELATLEAQLGAVPSGPSVNPSGSNPSGTNTDTSALSTWRSGAIAQLQKDGLSPAVAGQQVALYLEKKPLTNATAVNSLHNIAFSAPAPIPSGSLPLPTLAKSVTRIVNPAVVANPAGGTDQAAVSALARAQAAVRANKGGPGAAQAAKNLAGAEKAVTARTTAAKRG